MMDNESPEVMDGTLAGDTPEDVAVLYSWANLQGAKYRDFSASRREYRAAMRHRAAEEQRLAEAAAQAEAEDAAAEAEKAAREAEEAARFHETAARRAAAAHQGADTEVEEAARARAMRHASEMSRIAAAERIEAARRAEAVAAAEAAARREAREMEEARASAERQAARYAESEHRRRELSGPQPVAMIPGQISDPYSSTQQVLPGRIFHQPVMSEDDMLPSRHVNQREARVILPQIDPAHPNAPMEREYLATGNIMRDAEIAARGTAAIAEAADRANSPVHHMYHEPNTAETKAAVDEFARYSKAGKAESSAARRAAEAEAIARFSSAAIPVARMPDLAPTYSSAKVPVVRAKAPSSDYVAPAPRLVEEKSSGARHAHRSGSILGLEEDEPGEYVPGPQILMQHHHHLLPVHSPAAQPAAVAPVAVQPTPISYTPVTPPAHRSGSILGLDLSPVEREPLVMAPVERAPVVAAPVEREPVAAPAGRSGSAIALEPSVGQKAYAAAKAEAAAKTEAAQAAQAAQAATRRVRGYAPDEASGFFAAYGSARAQVVAAPAVAAPTPSVPEWLNEPTGKLEAAVEAPSRISEARRKLAGSSGNTPAAPPVEALQHSRERVAARWYALKGVFDHGIEEQKAELENRHKEKEAPMVAIFSLAGGVGKTSMVATLGRALSGSGEKVLLTDTTSHGLLPFYFGASELRPGVMRTFSPPSGSADAAICLVSYDVLQRTGDQASQDWFAAEIMAKSQGMARVILDLSSNAPWVARRLGRMDATMLIPLAPDMNSVISLGAIEKFFAEMKDSSGKAVEPFYVMNQFDSSMALHLDVREVMRQQLDDRLLPFVIRRAAAVPESLAEGMTVVDYAAESPVAEDYRNLANWLKSRSAPALSSNKTARWSER